MISPRHEARSLLAGLTSRDSRFTVRYIKDRAAALIEIDKIDQIAEAGRQDRISNLLKLAELAGTPAEAQAAMEEARAMLLGEDSAAAARVRAFCQEIQVAGGDYHSRITTGQIVNLLEGRDANDDGPLLRAVLPAPVAPPAAA